MKIKIYKNTYTDKAGYSYQEETRNKQKGIVLLRYGKEISWYAIPNKFIVIEE